MVHPTCSIEVMDVTGSVTGACMHICTLYKRIGIPKVSFVQASSAAPPRVLHWWPLQGTEEKAGHAVLALQPPASASTGRTLQSAEGASYLSFRQDCGVWSLRFHGDDRNHSGDGQEHF